MATRGAPETTYGIKFDSNAKEVGEQGASALEQLRASIENASASIKGHGDVLKRLKGSSDDVKKARTELKAKIDAERTAITQSSLALMKSGTSYEKLTEQHKKFSDEVKKNAAEKLKKQNDSLKSALEGVGGPAAALQGKFSSLSSVLGGAQGLTGLMTLGAVALAAAFVAVAAGIVAGIAKLSEWIVVSGDHLRSQNLMREAMTGNAEDAAHLGNQVDELAKKVTVSREEINKFASELSLAGLGGKTLVDTLNAAEQAQSAIGGNAADRIKGLVERGRLTGRFSLGQFETQGLGVQFGDVAKALAANTKTSVQDAAQALIQGRVTLGDGAEALRTTFEKRFGKVNLAKMLDLDVMKQKFTETLESLTKDIDLEPLLNAVEDLAKIFDTSTETGADLKLLVEALGSGLVGSVSESGPVVKGFLEGLILISLDLYDSWLDLRIAFKDAFGDNAALKNVDMLKTGFEAAKIAVEAVAVAMAVIVTASVAFGTATAAAVASIVDAVKLLKDVWDIVTAIDSASDKIAAKIGTASNAGIKNAAATHDTSAKTVLTNAFIPGFAEGLASVPYDDFVARLHKGERVLTASESQAYASLVDAHTHGGSSGGGGSVGAGAGVTIESLSIPITIEGGANAGAEELAPMVQRELVRALELVLRGRGLVPAAQGAATP